MEPCKYNNFIIGTNTRNYVKKILTSRLISVIALISDPNFSSPANVDASVECKNKYEDYVKRVKELVKKSLQELPEDYIFTTQKKTKKIEKKSPKMEDYMLEEDDVYVYDPDASNSEEDEEEDIEEDIDDLNDEELKKYLEEEEKNEKNKKNNDKKEEKKM
jgi:ubiquitin-conjugating enzyme E2 R